MNRIEVIVRPEKFDAIKDALSEMGYPGMTVTKVNGHGSQKGIGQVWRGRWKKVSYRSFIKNQDRDYCQGY